MLKPRAAKTTPSRWTVANHTLAANEAVSGVSASRGNDMQLGILVHVLDRRSGQGNSDFEAQCRDFVMRLGRDWGESSGADLLTASAPLAPDTASRPTATTAAPKPQETHDVFESNPESPSQSPPRSGSSLRGRSPPLQSPWKMSNSVSFTPCRSMFILKSVIVGPRKEF